MKCYKALWLDCEISAQKMVAELIRKRCVGSLYGEPVYFIPRDGKTFYLVIESRPRHFRQLTDDEHRRFKEQSRVEGPYYETRSRERRHPPRPA